MKTARAAFVWAVLKARVSVWLHWNQWAVACVAHFSYAPYVWHVQQAAKVKNYIFLNSCAMYIYAVPAVFTRDTIACSVQTTQTKAVCRQAPVSFLLFFTLALFIWNGICCKKHDFIILSSWFFICYFGMI